MEVDGTCRMADGPAKPVQVHSLLHTNLNTVDVAAAASFYAEVLALSPGMKTARVPADGRALGVEGTPVSEAWFLYDHRGPRAAPAIEVLEWELPATVGEHPGEPHHIGVSSLGYAVPSLERARERARAHGRPWSELADWPVRGRVGTVARMIDLDGVPVELVQRDESAPVFSHLRVNCSDLVSSMAWYERLGFTPEVVARSVAADGAVLSYASLVTDGDLSFSLELTQWEEPTGCGQPSSPAYHRGLYRIALGVDDVQGAYSVLASGQPGLPAPEFVELPGTRLGGVMVMFLRDPDGVVVELVGRPRSAMTARR
jgi:catechol 2,3-dioxygenase-like lactoylglutathione lyase family enzyme